MNYSRNFKDTNNIASFQARVCLFVLCGCLILGAIFGYMTKLDNSFVTTSAQALTLGMVAGLMAGAPLSLLSMCYVPYVKISDATQISAQRKGGN